MGGIGRREPSLAEWAALGLLCEAPVHGWAIAQALQPTGDIGRVYACSRPLVYRGLTQLREAGLVESRGRSPSDAGPARTTLGPTRRGRTTFARWREEPVEHVRSLRSALMLKLLFHDRAGMESEPLLVAQAAVLVSAERALAVQLEGSTGFDRTLALWRLSTVRGALSFVEALLDRRAVEPVVYRSIGLVSSPHADLDGMPLQPQADGGRESRIDVFEPHRGCLSDVEGFSHMWVLSHLHEVVGWGSEAPVFLDDVPHGTFATRSPWRPNPLGLSLVAIVRVDAQGVVVAGVDLLDGTPVLDLKPYVPLFDAPEAGVRSGWFDGRAERIFERRSDRRFVRRSELDVSHAGAGVRQRRRS